MPSAPTTHPWGAPTQETLLGGPDSPPRNAADLTYAAPGLQAFRDTDVDPRPTTEPGDAAPVPRPLLRRVLGSAAGTTTEVVQLLDALPLDLRPGSGRADVARMMLAHAGIPVPPDLPDAALLRLHAALPDLRPLGCAEAYLAAFEAVLGPGERVSTAKHPWRHVIARSGAATLVVSEVLIDLDPPDPQVGPGGVFLHLYRAPEYVARLLRAMRPGMFSTPVVTPGEDALAHLT